MLFNSCRFTALVLLGILVAAAAHAQAVPEYSVRQITSGPQHHSFGYIGHVGTIPWNASGRSILALRFGFHDHMPTLSEPAEILLLDTKSDFEARVVDETRGWNLQQGAMLYWNPLEPETQFFFNDRDPISGEVFTVLFDVVQGRRIREYRFSESPIANGGVSQTGGEFCAINYGRLARLRLVTGLAGAEDWSRDANAPVDDGVFKVDVATGKRTLLVSYRQMRELIREKFPAIDEYAIFVNHTLWNRTGNRVYFFCRANFRSPLPKVDIPFTVNADGTGLTTHRYLGGHPEWDVDGMLIASDGERQVRYDTDSKRIVDSIGDTKTFVDPGGDIALAANGRWFINGHKIKEKRQVFFTLMDRESGQIIRTRGFSVGSHLSGATRIDPAPCWNRRGTQVLFGAHDAESETRQLFLLNVHGQ